MGIKEVAMADLRINSIGNDPIQPLQQVNTKPVETVSKESAGEILKKQNEDSASRKEKLQDLIGVSKDGDTAQASVKAKDLLKEQDNSTVVEKKKSSAAEDMKKLSEKLSEEISDKNSMKKKADEAAEKVKDKALEATKEKAAENAPSKVEVKAPEKAAEAESKKTVVQEQKQPISATLSSGLYSSGGSRPRLPSYKEFNPDELQKMYLDGDISRYELDKEMSSRVDEGIDTSPDYKVFNEGIVKALEDGRKTSQRMTNINDAYSEDASTRISAEMRVKMINAAEFEKQQKAAI